MGMIMLQIQVLLAVPFISTNAWSYLTRAFELTRKFHFKWTVNWKFVGEEIFSSRGFAMGLMGANMALMLLFAYTRWTRPSGLSPWALAKTVIHPMSPQAQAATSSRVKPDFILTTILTSLVTGLFCARTLHYQFFAYIAWSTPFLLWKSGLPAYLVVATWLAQEVVWNIYPSTSQSSLIVVGCLAVQVIGAWWGTRVELLDMPAVVEPDVKELG